MTHDEYEQRRRALEEQRRADVELIEAGYRAKLQALQAVWEAASGEPAAPAVESVERPEPVPSPGKAPEPVVRRERSGVWETYQAVTVALDLVGEEFDKNDLCRILEIQPTRTSLHQALWRLEGEGLIETVKQGRGRHPARYRKVGT